MDAHQAWLELQADNVDSHDEKRVAQDEKDYWQERLGLGGWADKGAQND